MARISDTKVCQLVEEDPPVVVVVDEQHGTEVVFTAAEAQALRQALAYFAPALGIV